MIGDYRLNETVTETVTKAKHPNQWTNDKSRRVTYRGYPLYLPDQDVIDKFVELYPTTRNEDLCQLVGRKKCYVSRLGNFLGLSKTKEFMEEQRNLSFKIALLPENRYKGKPKKGELPQQLRPWVLAKGHKPLISKERYEATKEARSQARKEMYRKERMRYLAGLPQQTNLNVRVPNRENTYRRHYLTKQCGYVEVERNVYVYTANTKRAPKIENDTRTSIRIYSESEWMEYQESKGNHVTAIQDWKDKQGGFNN